MPRNKLIDLNNALFEQLERLNDDDLVGDDLERELKRTKAICAIGHTIINNAQVALEAQKHIDEYALDKSDQSNMLKITAGE